MSGYRRELVLRLAVIALGAAALFLAAFGVPADKALAGTDSYQYDALGRLVQVTFADGSSITYAYDSAGNRITVTQTAAP